MFRGPHSHKSMKKSQSAQTTYFLSYYSDNILSFPLRYSYSMWCTYVHVPNNMSPVSAPCQLPQRKCHVQYVQRGEYSPKPHCKT